MEIINLISTWTIPIMICVIPLYGYLKGVPVYEKFVEGGREGLDMAIKIMPYMIAIFFAMGVFDASGGMDLVTRFLSPILSAIGMPPQILPLAVVRPLSGSSALGITASLLREWGPDSFVGRLASTMQGSTDTTFYVLSVYFGSVGVTRTRHALPTGLIGDVTGILAALYVCRLFFG